MSVHTAPSLVASRSVALQRQRTRRPWQLWDTGGRPVDHVPLADPVRAGDTSRIAEARKRSPTGEQDNSGDGNVLSGNKRGVQLRDRRFRLVLIQSGDRGGPKLFGCVGTSAPPPPPSGDPRIPCGSTQTFI
ncbi:hypothetical protein Q5P01_008278 [Channa striata]|uniref:Uncharacterized protein n=1 Tax=Channa striata TaxID=64152 RepID=A0AA88NB06_CHASR|nr:hypothetical protein Q5P01_008278 [Channa striata]